MAVLMTPPYMTFTDDSGNPLSGGKVYTYTAGTLTPKATYTDSTEGTSNANPVILDSAGRAAIWLNGSYKFIVKDSADNTIRTTDNVTAFSTSATNIDQILPSQTGNAGKYLTTNGTNSSWGTVTTTSGLVHIKTVTASASTSVDFVNGTSGVVLNSTYKAYMVVITDLIPATNATELWMRTSTNAGTSYDSGASDYAWGACTQNTVGTFTSALGTNAAQIPLTAGSAIGNASGEKYSGSIWLFSPSSASDCFVMFEGIAYDSNTISIRGHAKRSATADVDAIRFLMSSGNITSGTFALYGVVS